MIAVVVAEKWRKRSIKLRSEADRLTEQAETKADWEAVLLVEEAARHLWSAYAWIVKQHEEASV